MLKNVSLEPGMVQICSWLGSTWIWAGSYRVLPANDYILHESANRDIRKALLRLAEGQRPTPMNVLRYGVAHNFPQHRLYSMIRRFLEVLRHQSARMWINQLLGDDAARVWRESARYWLRPEDIPTLVHDGTHD